MQSVEIDRMSKTFGGRVALRVDSLSIAPGEMVALIGPSGAGKSTLLRLTAGLIAGDRGTGSIRLSGRVVQQGGRVAREIRSIRSGVGFIFQQFNLVGRLPVLTNVLTGMLSRAPMHRRWTRRFRYEEKAEAMRALHYVGMSAQAAQRASTLSGGQQQRVAIARAIVQGAKLILADEPIASLDPASATRVMQTLRRMNQESGVTVVVSLHQIDYAQRYCDRVIAMKDGEVRCDCQVDELHLDRLRMIYGPMYDELGAGASRGRGASAAELVAGQRAAELAAIEAKAGI